MNEEEARGIWSRSLRRRTAPGAPPGTLKADPDAPVPVIRVMTYGHADLREESPAEVRDLEGVVGSHPVTWVNVDGLGNAQVVSELGALFGLHPLALEDVMNVHQRAKVEDYGDRLFLVMRMAGENTVVTTEQFSLFLGPDFVLTFQETVGDCLDPVRDRLRKNRGKIRGGGTDYLAYALVDAVVDHYFPVLESLGDRLEDLEDRILLKPTEKTIAAVHEIKHDLRTLRRAIWPQREALSWLLREPSPLVGDETRIYLRDTADHVVQCMDLVETYRELCADLVDLYMSSVSNRMNEVMKVLTIIATIFIPLSFVAGVYGMNFDREASPWSMPELGWSWGYPGVLSVMAGAAALMLVYFRRRGWLGGRGAGEADDEPRPPAPAAPA